MSQSPTGRNRGGITEPPDTLGVWIVGACGAVSTTTMIGCHAIREGYHEPRGMATETPPFTSLPLAGLDSIRFGGVDLFPPNLIRQAEKLEKSAGIFGRDLLENSEEFLESTAENIGPGIKPGDHDYISEVEEDWVLKDQQTPFELVNRCRDMIQEFRERENLDSIVVVNLASTEPGLTCSDLSTKEEFIQALKQSENRKQFLNAPSVLYATAAIQEECPYINFTPSPGASVPGLKQLALQKGVPLAGKDAKTGETLIKTVLAPMFSHRALKVLSWEGHNILGNEDGKTLTQKENRESKTENKQASLSDLLSDNDMHSGVRIDYVPSLGDWKTAWDFIHFEGFLNTKMSLQLIWQGSDSALAGPLVLDLVRFADLADRRGEKGPLSHLASYFKAPLGTDEHDFHKQFHQLLEYTAKVAKQTVYQTSKNEVNAQ